MASTYTSNVTMSQETTDHPKTGVVLLNMGGPDRQEDVQPFLYNLFRDREIIRLGPFFLQKPLAWLISRRRAEKSRNNYARIGGGSPLKAITWRAGSSRSAALQNVRAPRIDLVSSSQCSRSSREN